MSNSLDPDQARRFVGPDLGPKCLQKLSADGTSRQRVNGKQKYTNFFSCYNWVVAITSAINKDLD